MARKHASYKAILLAEAVGEMARRYGDAERECAHALGRYLAFHFAEDAAERDHWRRAATRRFKALRRLTSALRDLDR